MLALNKIDCLADKQALLPVLAAYADTGVFAQMVPISAKEGDGVGELVELLCQTMPLGPKLFPEDMVTDRAERFLAGELIREQLFRQLGQELPYAAAVVVESMQDREARDDVIISAIIYVERESQRGMVVGKGGQRIKTIGQRARHTIGKLFGCPVHVKLHVKVASNWSHLEQRIREMGYQ